MVKSKKLTLLDIAQSMGLSKATVSLALNDNPMIAEKTRKAVQSKAKKWGMKLIC